MAVERALKFCWRIWQKKETRELLIEEWMDARTVLCSRHPAGFRILLAWSSGLLSFRLDRVLQQFLQKDNRREKKRGNPRICFYLLPWVHSRPCPGVSAKPHYGNQNFSQMANGEISIFNRNNQEISISLNVKSPITEMGNRRYIRLEREQTFFSFGFSLQETRAC